MGKHCAIDIPDSRHQAICRTQLEQFLRGTPPALPGECQRAILDETARIAQIGKVFADGALPASPATLYGLRSELVQSDGVTFFFSSRRRHTRSLCDWSSDVCSSD